MAALAALVAAGAAWAQDDEAWSNAMSEGVGAYQEQDWDGAVAAFERALTLTDVPMEEADSLRALAIVRMQQGRAADTLALTGRALEILAAPVEALDEQAVTTSRDLWLLRTEVFAALGQEEEWRFARGTAAEFFNMLPQPGWRIDDDEAARHFLSGFTCPAVVEGFPRVEFTTYSTSDVGCSYGVDRDFPGLVTIYFTFRSGAPFEASVDSMRDEIDRSYGSPEIAEDDEIRRSDGAAARRIVYAKGATLLPHDFSGGWLADVDGWTSKVRISWGAGLDRPFIDRLADALSVQSTDRTWVGDCTLVTARAEEVGDMAASLVGGVGASTMATSDGDFDLRAVLEADACWTGSITTPQGEIVTRRLRTLQDLSILVAAPMPWLPDRSWFSALVVGAPESDDTFIVEFAPERTVIWATLDAPPSDEQFSDILIEVLRGDRQPVVEVSKTGGEISLSIREP